MPRRKSAGFTLIELIVVIVILGVLAAVALPRFAQMQREARVAKLSGVLGSLKGAAAMAHALQQTQGLATNASVNMEGQMVTMINGYPTADNGGIMAAISMPTTQSQANEGLSVITSGTTLTVQALGAADSATCSFTYTSPAANYQSPTYGSSDANGVVPNGAGC
ncbi:MAG TPA: type II secretion system protein [Azospira sp.]|nr:type II secretion system protein [Azospira sp.]